jgi:hypothetical protein
VSLNIESQSLDPTRLTDTNNVTNPASPATFSVLKKAQLLTMTTLLIDLFALDTVIQVFEVCGRDENATQACLMSGGFL